MVTRRQKGKLQEEKSPQTLPSPSPTLPSPAPAPHWFKQGLPRTKGLKENPQLGHGFGMLVSH